MFERKTALNAKPFAGRALDIRTGIEIDEEIPHFLSRLVFVVLDDLATTNRTQSKKQLTSHMFVHRMNRAICKREVCHSAIVHAVELGKTMKVSLA